MRHTGANEVLILKSNQTVTLFLHHFEETWEEGLRQHGLTPLEYSDQIIDFLSTDIGQTINNVILTKWESCDSEAIHSRLFAFLSKRKCDFQVQILPYWIEAECFSDQDRDAVIHYEKNGWDYGLLIEPWQQELKDHKQVYLAGAFEDECIVEATLVLDTVRGQGQWQRLEGLIVGSGHEYEYNLTSEMCDSLMNKGYGGNRAYDPDEDDAPEFPVSAAKSAIDKQIMMQAFARNDFYDELLDTWSWDLLHHFMEVSERYVESLERNRHCDFEI